MRLRKRYLFIAIGVIVLMAAAGIAYAWFTANASLGDNTIGTATMAIDVRGSDGGVINVAGLAPRNAPAFGSTDPTPALNTQDVAAESSYPAKFFYVHNTGDMPEMFYAWLNVTAETAQYLRDYVYCRIWLNPTDYPGTPGPDWWKRGEARDGQYLVYEGPLGLLDTAAEGRTYLRTITPGGTKEELPVGYYATYKILFWLHSSAGNEYQHQSLTATLNVVGGQPDGWGSW